MVYVVITAGLAIPVWYATHSHFAEDGPNTASLDVVPSEPIATQTPGLSPVARERSATAAGAETISHSAPSAAPYIASLTPLPHEQETPKGGLTLSFQGDSWMQVSAPDGRLVEKAMLKSGETRSYAPGQVGRVVLGNASVVQVQQSGSTVDLTPYRRANVARFAVSSDGSVVPASE
ncbi:hypothetical protein XaFJ1_GM001573 [Xanthomonas albilineans]|nr:hypothetical protein XaFJ1_GM001573 [Xanthomonas albilineans]